MEKASKVIINLCGSATVYQSLHGPINMGPFLLIPFMWPIGMSILDDLLASYCFMLTFICCGSMF